MSTKMMRLTEHIGGARRLALHGHRLASPCVAPYSPVFPIVSQRRLFASQSESINLASALSDTRFFDARSFVLASATASASVDVKDFVLYPRFLDTAEEDVLLRCGLRGLDSASNSSEARRKRREWRQRKVATSSSEEPFLPEHAYAFEGSHFDGVISGYRETQVTDWGNTITSEEERALLASTLDRLYALISPTPTAKPIGLRTPPDLLTHVLHLGRKGYIDPHVDNVDASGDIILGASLGGDRVMRLEASRGQGKSESSAASILDVLLERGSVYIQRRAFRYKFEHSIPAVALFRGRQIGGTQRVSVMLRDRKEGS